MSSIRNIRFSFPCKEDINEMTSCEQGKHCGSCKRTIVDFRNKSAEELDRLRETNKQICGIFSEKQVAQGYENYRQLVATTVLTLGISVLSANIHAQEESDPFKFPAPVSKDSVSMKNENMLVGVIIDDSPEYPGGMIAMRNFFKENVIYPSDSVEGKVAVSFIVDTLGRTRNIQIRKSLSPLADAEIVRVVGLMVFKPATHDGKPIESKMSLPFTFRLEKKD